MRGARFGLALLLSAPVFACAWTYSPAISVTETNKRNTFLHLESSGNRSIAIGPQQLAVVWEDNRGGKPAVYVAFKAPSDRQFTPALRVSERGPAYEPAVAALADGRFVVLWEAEDHIWSRLVSAKYRGPVQQVSKRIARQATVTSVNGQLWLAWAAKAGAHFQIVTTAAKVKVDRLQLVDIKPVDPNPPKQDQLYPSIAIVHGGVVIAWEDRRYGHTRIVASRAASGQAFSALQQINQLNPAQSEKYGKGTGAMRVALASDGQHKLVASWLDKRNFAEGYDVYAAFSQDGGKSFRANEKVEDMLGANQAQWHAVSAMDSQGNAIVAWDDQRDGNPDVWLSGYQAGGWSDDDSPEAAHTAASQTHPAIAFDQQGRLHLVFLSSEDGKATLRYLMVTSGTADSGR